MAWRRHTSPPRPGTRSPRPGPGRAEDGSGGGTPASPEADGTGGAGLANRTDGRAAPAYEDGRHRREEAGTGTAERGAGHPPETAEAQAPETPDTSGTAVPPKGPGELPKGPGELPKKSWSAVLKRTATEYRDDNLGDWAAALTYYGVLSIFPALLALVSIAGLLGTSAVNSLLDNLRTFAPGPARDTLTTAVEQVRGGTGTAGIALVVGTALALWSASRYVAGFMRAANSVYDIGEGRPVWKTLPIRLGITLALMLLLTASAIAVVLTGSLADRAGDILGVGDTATLVWDIAKWPVLAFLAGLMIALLYWAAPNVRQAGFRWITPGSVLAVLLWIAVSLAFGFYVANFGNYNKTYGAFATAIVFLVWLWISNLAILLGLEFNAELERGRAIRAGHAPDEEPFLEPRDTRKLRPEDTPGQHRG